MSCIRFSAADWASICSHFNLNTDDVFALLSLPRSVIKRTAEVPRAITAVSDSGSEASSPPAKVYSFASSKTADFAKDMVASGSIASMDSLIPTGKGGKITMSDVKKAIPAKPRGRKRKGRKRDPNAPKQPQNGYMLFANATRSDRKAAHADLKPTDLVKLAASEWRALDDETRQPWLDRAAAEKVRYAAEKAKYAASKSDTASVSSAASAASKASEASAASKASEASKAPEAPKAAKKAPKVKIPKELREEVRALLAKESKPWTSEMKLEALKQVKVARAVAKTAAKAAKVQLKCDGVIKEILSHVALNKLNASDEKSLRNRVKDVDEHCTGSLIDGVTLKELKSILKEQKALHRKLTKAAPKAKKAAPKPAVVFDDDFSDSDSDSELEEDAVQFEYDGERYWRDAMGFVMEEEDGPIVGRWDDDEKAVVFRDED